MGHFEQKCRSLIFTYKPEDVLSALLRSTLHATVYSGAHSTTVVSHQIRELKDSPVRVVVNAHYVIEREFIRRGFKRLSRF